MTVWNLYANLSRRLLIWGGTSMVAGLVLLMLGDPFWRGFGIQAAAWGAVDAAIAVLGSRAARRRRAGQADALEHTRLLQEERNLRRLLLVNTGLDVLYVAGGMALALTLGAGDAAWRGHGWGIVVQGAFLFAFDLVHAQQVQRTDQ
jgi:uncharacterized protein DUF6992